MDVVTDVWKNFIMSFLLPELGSGTFHFFYSFLWLMSLISYSNLYKQGLEFEAFVSNISCWLTSVLLQAKGSMFSAAVFLELVFNTQCSYDPIGHISAWSHQWFKKTLFMLWICPVCLLFVHTVCAEASDFWVSTQEVSLSCSPKLKKIYRCL